MLSKAMVQQLNEHVTLEFYSSNLYLQMSAKIIGEKESGVFFIDRAVAEILRKK